MNSTIQTYLVNLYIFIEKWNINITIWNIKNDKEVSVYLCCFCAHSFSGTAT